MKLHSIQWGIIALISVSSLSIVILLVLQYFAYKRNERLARLYDWIITFAVLCFFSQGVGWGITIIYGLGTETPNTVASTAFLKAVYMTSCFSAAATISAELSTAFMIIAASKEMSLFLKELVLGAVTFRALFQGIALAFQCGSHPWIINSDQCKESRGLIQANPAVQMFVDLALITCSSYRYLIIQDRKKRVMGVLGIRLIGPVATLCKLWFARKLIYGHSHTLDAVPFAITDLLATLFALSAVIVPNSGIVSWLSGDKQTKSERLRADGKV